jgi:drug/metabolite transporter (DMT)-like permease
MRKAVNGSTAAFMVLPCLAWGLQQVSIKVIAGDVSPLLQVASRSGVAALLVWLFSRLILRDRWLNGAARAGSVVGLLCALDFLFTAEGLRWTSASHMSVFLYTGPLFAAFGLHLRLHEERLTHRQWLGMGLAFAGIATVFLGTGTEQHSPAAASNQLLGDLLGLCGGLSWGVTTLVIRTTRLSDAPATQTLFYQLVGACALLFPLALITGQSVFRPTPLAWCSLAFQAIIASFAANLMWFWLLRKHIAAQLGVLSYMSPLFGVGFGVLLLHEEVTPAFLFGAALVLIGIVVVNSRNLNAAARADAPGRTPASLAKLPSARLRFCVVSAIGEKRGVRRKS